MADNLCTLINESCHVPKASCTLIWREKKNHGLATAAGLDESEDLIEEEKPGDSVSLTEEIIYLDALSLTTK